MEHLAEVSHGRCNGARLERAVTWITIRQHPAAHSGQTRHVDFKLSGEYDRFFWSLSVNNVLNALYYDYAVASTFTDGRFSAYPLPGRSFIVKAGATF